jgi:hypothetical protein
MQNNLPESIKRRIEELGGDDKWYKTLSKRHEAMVRRCYSKSSSAYKNYGGRDS